MQIHVSRFYELATRSGLPSEQRDSEWDGQGGEETSVNKAQQTTRTSAIKAGDSDRQVLAVE